MGVAEKSLYNLVAEGDVGGLNNLLREDPLILDRVSFTSPNKTPLHIAVMHGHLAIVRKILNHNHDQKPYPSPEISGADDHKLLLAGELDSQQASALHIASTRGYTEIVEELLSAAPDLCYLQDSQGQSPLHLAAMKGHLETVKLLLLVAPDLCFLRDSQGRNPLHVAATKGNIDVLHELIRATPGAAREKSYQGLNILHLCVKHKQLEALKSLVPNLKEMINAGDDDGNTILHLAVLDDQTETIRCLLNPAHMTNIDLRARNSKGQTASDMLLRQSGSRQNEKLIDILKPNNSSVLDQIVPVQWLNKTPDVLMVVAILVATMAFQAIISPPGGVWQDDQFNASHELIHRAGKSIMAYNYPNLYKFFLFFNYLAFFFSFLTILALMKAGPLFRYSLLTLVITMALTVTFIGGSFAASIVVVTPRQLKMSTLAWLLIMFAWLICMVTLFDIPVLLLRAHSFEVKRKIRKARLDEFVQGENNTSRHEEV